MSRSVPRRGNSLDKSPEPSRSRAGPTAPSHLSVAPYRLWGGRVLSLDHSFIRPQTWLGTAAGQALCWAAESPLVTKTIPALLLTELERKPYSSGTYNPGISAHRRGDAGANFMCKQRNVQVQTQRCVRGCKARSRQPTADNPARDWQGSGAPWQQLRRPTSAPDAASFQLILCSVSDIITVMPAHDPWIISMDRGAHSTFLSFFKKF